LGTADVIDAREESAVGTLQFRKQRQGDREASESQAASVLRARVATRAAEIAFFGVLPFVTLATFFEDWNRRGIVAIDFRQFYGAARAILAGTSPYPTGAESVGPLAHQYEFPYPPLSALATMPLTIFPLKAAELLVIATSVALVLAIPYVLGVRDWRCFGLVLLWPPVLSAIQTSNPTILLALAAALAWRFRERPVRLGASVGVTLAVKFFLWPLLVWLVSSRRLLSSALAVTLGVGLLLFSWAIIGFSGFLRYPALLHANEERWGDDAYTLRNVALDFSAPPVVATTVWLAVGIALLVATVVLSRRGDDRRAFIVALAAAFALSPLVWLGYFAFLVVVVAIAQPRLGYLWFLPLATVISTGSGHPTSFVACWTLLVAAVTLALAARGASAPARWWVFARRNLFAGTSPM
jgi:Glycosyltransferase family 87